MFHLPWTLSEGVCCQKLHPISFMCLNSFHGVILVCKLYLSREQICLRLIQHPRLNDTTKSNSVKEFPNKRG